MVLLLIRTFLAWLSKTVSKYAHKVMKMSPCQGGANETEPKKYGLIKTETEMEDALITAPPEEMKEGQHKKIEQGCKWGNHQCLDSDSECTCNRCKELYTKHYARFLRWRKQKDQQTAEAERNGLDINTIPPGSPRCDRCRNHGIVSLDIEHKGKCQFEECKCLLCNFLAQRLDNLNQNLKSCVSVATC